MSSINDQNILSPVQANRTDLRTIHEDALVPHASANAFNYDWFVLPDNTVPTLPKAEPAISAINTIARVDGTVSLGNSMELRVERIIQFILPRI